MRSLIWAKVDRRPSPAAVAAAKKADVVIAVVGITSRLEGEEMPVERAGISRAATAPVSTCRNPKRAWFRPSPRSVSPLVVVLMNGPRSAVNWEKAHANAILEAWYSGEEGGAAIAATLSGKNNPAGRLPVTFYTGIDQLPHFEDYSMATAPIATSRVSRCSRLAMG